MTNTITLNDGKQYPVRYTFHVLAQIEQETGRKNILNEMQDLGINDALVIAYLGMKKADPSMDKTMEEVGDLFNGKTLDQVFKAYADDMIKLMPADEKKP